MIRYRKLIPGRVIDAAATGRNIGTLCCRAGITVGQLAELLGVDSVAGIYRWMRGDSVTSTDNLYRLSFIFGLPMEDVLRFSDIA